jgi:uncharacterized BrkB/YihY/UPF0761 family membrane protein
MSELIDAAKRGRRRAWIVVCALPGYLTLAAFGFIALMQASRFDPPDWAMLAIVPFGVIAMLSWALAPFFALCGIILLWRDRWRRERSRRERVGLTLLALGAPLAWVLGNVIIESYHLLR